MTQLAKPPSFSEEAKKISASMGQRLKPLGFKKRSNSFNRRLENGLVHQVSIFSVGAYSIDHGKFYIHAGCYVPEAELYLQNAADPNWVTDALCTIRGGFPKDYLSLRKVAADLDLLSPHLEDALEALDCVSTYNQIMGEKKSGLQSTEFEKFTFGTPRPLVTACILIARKDAQEALKTIQQYLATLKASKCAQLGHIEVVSEWLKEIGLEKNTDIRPPT